MVEASGYVALVTLVSDTMSRNQLNQKFKLIIEAPRYVTLVILDSDTMSRNHLNQKFKSMIEACSMLYALTSSTLSNLYRFFILKTNFFT